MLQTPFTTLNGGASYYHPLTWITYQIDTQIFGLNPGAIHLTNLLFHLANTWLLLRLLHSLTGRLWRSAVVAALFALHPLHVETVCWASERKSLVCTFFWMLTLLAYTGYARRPALWRYGLVILGFAASLMSKPMAVTLPLVLLLLDFWPLGRWRLAEKREEDASPSPDSTVSRRSQRFSGLAGLILEKLPMICMAGFASWLTVVAQNELGAMVTLSEMPIRDRLANSVLSYVLYLGKMVWPSNLSPIYPLHPVGPWWKVAGCAIVLLAVTLLVVRCWHSRPYLITGWLWYMGTLVPMIGLVQVGAQCMADRYTYLSLVGVSLMAVWGGADAVARRPAWRVKSRILCAGVLALFAAVSAVQAAYWKNSVRLFKHAAAVTEANHIALDSLGLAYGNEGNASESKYFLGETLKINPLQARVCAAMGRLAFAAGDTLGAVSHGMDALRIDPNEKEAHLLLAKVYEKTKVGTIQNSQKAVEEARRACEASGYRDRESVLLLAEARISARDFRGAEATARRVLDLSISTQEREQAAKIFKDINRIQAQKAGEASGGKDKPAQNFRLLIDASHFSRPP